jgi:hypothetical protein
MLKKILKRLLVLSLVIFVFFKFIVKGNNRFTVYYHHGFWLPSSTKNITFSLYPDFPRITDDWANCECEMNNDDYETLLRKQEYNYVISQDMSEDKKSIAFNESDFLKIPDSLIKKLPASFKCKSTTGDFLVISAKIKDSNTVFVTLYTDWN